jgi:hypothetical protein
MPKNQRDKFYYWDNQRLESSSDQRLWELVNAYDSPEEACAEMFDTLRMGAERYLQASNRLASFLTMYSEYLPKEKNDTN